MDISLAIITGKQNRDAPFVFPESPESLMLLSLINNRMHQVGHHQRIPMVLTFARYVQIQQDDLFPIPRQKNRIITVCAEEPLGGIEGRMLDDRKISEGVDQTGIFKIRKLRFRFVRYEKY